jgi:hypothetical protein
VAQLVPSGQTGALDNLSTSQAGFRTQIATALEGLRQLIGATNIASGSSESTDPLTAPFVLFVNPYIGKDTFASGSYNTKEATGTTEEIVAQKLKRLENQRLTCGYTRHSPFKTINRAIIEAAIITSKNWYINDPLAHVDCVCIVLAPGLHIIYNNPSTDSSAISISTWADGFNPTWQHLIKFNPTEGGVLLPRGASIVSEFGDLRHTVIRPSWVPEGNVDETPTYSNGVATYSLRRQIIKTTGGGYAYGITTMDKIGLAESHHLLSVFGHATRAELDTFYANVFTACGTGGNLSQALLVARQTEYTIAAPISGTPTQAWDSTASASFYIFQCTVRSNFGMGRLWVDGSKVLGFKSFVLANFTGVSLQKSISENGDMRCWQKYSGGNWVAVSNYEDYISQIPDNIRQNPARRSVGVAAINEGFIQKVSIFDIGEGVQSLVDTGGEIDSNNGNSSFGGCAGIAKGYRRAALPSDKNWQVSAIKVPLSPEFKTGNIQRFYLGTVSAFTSSTITLSSGLAPYGTSSTIPDTLGQNGYTLPSGSYIWVENQQGTDWRAPLTGSAWSSSAPAQINITTALTNPSGAAVDLGGDGISLAIGARVYVRRLVDTRTPAERRISVKLSNTTAARVPAASSVLQTDTTSSSIARTLSSSSEVLLVSSAGLGDTPGSGVLKTAEITLRRGGNATNYANGATYLAGTVVLYANKHYINSKKLTTTSSVPDPTQWQETFVHMESSFAPEDNIKNEALILVFDTDTDGAEVTTTCGINWSTVFGTSGSFSVASQYRVSTDYLGVFLLLRALGYESTDTHAALVPRSEAARSRNPGLTSSPATTLALSSVSPSGGAANAAANWPVEFRRPSTLWMGSHRWFGSGTGNYSKAVPAAAQDMSAQNKFTYYFTSQGGGRVIPQGSQEDGLLVSPRGLEDTTTGQTLSVENIGAGDINTSQGTIFDVLSVTNSLTVGGQATFSGGITFNSGQVSQTTRLGPARLAPYAELIKTGVAASVATNDASINGSPDIVTVPGLNAWKNANQLVSALQGELLIYVSATGTDRNLQQMIAEPPNVASRAIPNLSRAAEYANYVLSGSEQTAVVRISPAYYTFLASVWNCNVRFESWNSGFTAMPYLSTVAGSYYPDTPTANDYYDGKGYDNAALIPQFITWRLGIRDSAGAGKTGGNTNLHAFLYGTEITFKKSAEFKGGFSFLGLAETIKWISGNINARATQIVFSLGGSSWANTESNINGLTYSSNTSTNVDQLLNSIRNSSGFTGEFSAATFSSPINIQSRATDSIQLKDCIFGPGLPSHKETLGGNRCPYINVTTNAKIYLTNVYLRGNTVITSSGIGCSSSIENSNRIHYGSALAQAPWTFRQFHHTFIGTLGPSEGSLSIDMVFGMIGDGKFVLTGEAGVAPYDYNFYSDRTGKLLPNHIHLVTNSSTSAELNYPSNDNDGPFLDQFIHAKTSITIENCFIDTFAGSTTQPVRSGFVGRFGSNGHNSTKSRGILLGCKYFGKEGGTISQTDISQTGTMFRRAGAINTTFIPYVQNPGNSTNYGEGYPEGDNPVITTKDNGSTTINLNMGARSWRAGISPQYGSIVRPDKSTNITT